MCDLDAGLLRTHVKKTFTNTGIYLTKESISYITELVCNAKPEQRHVLIGRLIKAIQEEGEQADLLDFSNLKEIIKREFHSKGGNSDTFKLENVGDWKPVAFDRFSKKFCTIERTKTWNKPSYDVYRHRFELVQEVLDENIVYQTSIESLFSCNNVEVRVLGMLMRGTKDELLVEDLTGTVQLNLDGADFAPALYFEGGIFEFEGVHNAGVLNVKRVSLPSIKPDALNIRTEEKCGSSFSRNPNDRIVFLSDVFLDEPRVLKALYKILSGFASFPPDVFVICGQFLKTQLAYKYTEAAQNGCRHLANIISEFSAAFVHTKFVLVPSLTDPLPLNVLPCYTFALPSTIQQCFSGMSNVLFGTNPCRIHFKGQTILICRDDLVEKLSRLSIHVPPDDKNISKYFCDTIWSQRHLSPLPLHFNPIIPQLDYLFHLHPVPDILVIADKYKSFDNLETEFNPLTINPGAFLMNNFEFQVLYPSLRRVEASTLPSD